MTQDEKYMKQAIKQAKKAYKHSDEVPIGCVIVAGDGKIIARGYNRRNTDKGHARACRARGHPKSQQKDRRLACWRTCTMLRHPESHARCVPGRSCRHACQEVVIGCHESQSRLRRHRSFNLLQMQQFNHQVQTDIGICGDECSTMLSTFFKELRKKRKLQGE